MRNIALALSLLPMLACAGAALRTPLASPGPQLPHAPVVVRFPVNPIIAPSTSPSLGENINGPSLIAAPAWLKNPLGKYYLYFAAHRGKFIRLAYADELAGPWHVYEPGTLRIEQTRCARHIASPDVHVDNEHKQLRMYFHCPIDGQKGQVSLLATSTDGLSFAPGAELLGDAYFRVFEFMHESYAITEGGSLYRSADGITGFEAGPSLFPEWAGGYEVRHVAVTMEGDTLSVFYSRRGDDPERIMFTSLRLAGDWKKWKVPDGVTILSPEQAWEGADVPPARSVNGAADTRVRQLRDPAIFRENQRTYLLYSVAGESGIAIAELH